MQINSNYWRTNVFNVRCFVVHLKANKANFAVMMNELVDIFQNDIFKLDMVSNVTV